MKELIAAIEDFHQRAYSHAMDLEEAEEKLGPLLRSQRVFMDLSMRQFGKVLGISATQVFDMETGKRAITESILEKLRKLA